MTRSRLKNYPYWVFDLDNTLYPAGTNLFDQIDKRMCGFIADYLEVDHAEAYRVQKGYFREYGTTLKGLMDCHGMEPGPYLEYVHRVDLEPLKRDSRMDKALHQLPGAIKAERRTRQLGTARKPASLNSASPQPENLDGTLSHQVPPSGLPSMVHMSFRRNPNSTAFLSH